MIEFRLILFEVEGGSFFLECFDRIIESTIQRTLQLVLFVTHSELSELLHASADGSKRNDEGEGEDEAPIPARKCAGLSHGGNDDALENEEKAQDLIEVGFGGTKIGELAAKVLLTGLELFAPIFEGEAMLLVFATEDGNELEATFRVVVVGIVEWSRG